MARSPTRGSAIEPSEWRVLLAVGVAMTVVEGVRPTASYRALEFGAGAVEVGVIAGAFATLALVAALPIGRAIDRRGERGFLLLGIGLLIVAAGIGALVPRLLALVAMQALLGLGQICVSVSAQTMAGNATGSRDLRFARLSVAVAAGHFAGPLLAGIVIDRAAIGPLVGGTRAFLVLAAGLALLSLALGVTAGGTARDRRDRGPDPTPQVRLRDLLRVHGMPQALYVGVVALTTLDLFAAYLPLIGEERGISPAVIGYLLATRAAMTVISRLVIGMMLRRLGRRRLLRAAMGVSAVAVLGLTLPGLPVWALFASMAIAGFAGGVAMPMTTAWVAERAPQGTRGVALGLRLTGNRSSQVVVPVALGGVAGALGPGAIFLVVSVAFGLAWQLVRRAPLAEPGTS